MASPQPPGARHRRDFGALSAEEVAMLDRAATEHGQPVVVLMEIAGLQVARRAWQLLDGARPVHVVAGHGNNGGDGLVAARYLLGWGAAVHVTLVGRRESAGELCRVQLAHAAAAGIAVTEAAEGEVSIRSAELVVDAVLGSGLHGDPRPAQARTITAMAGHDVLAVDLPSGLDATTGIPGSPTAHATWTVTLAAMKRGLWTPAGRALAGDLVVADIGVPASAWRSCGLEPPAAVRGGEFWPVPSDTP